jgi:hypothetical protein
MFLAITRTTNETGDGGRSLAPGAAPLQGFCLQLMQIIRNRGHIVAPSHRLDECGDPDDNVFLEYADKAGADYLITGNSRHFPKFWKKDQDHHRPRVHQPDRASLDSVKEY